MTTHRNLKPHYAEPKGKSGPVIVVNAAREHQAGVCGARGITSSAGYAACCHLPADHKDVMHSDGWQSWFDRRDTSARSSSVKKGEVMEPTTEAGQAALNHMASQPNAIVYRDHGVNVTAREAIIAIEQEARANADRELRELRELLDLAYEMRDDECAGINYGCNSVQAFDAARAERKS